MPLNPICIDNRFYGRGEPLLFIAGPCVIENETHTLEISERAGMNPTTTTLIETDEFIRAMPQVDEKALEGAIVAVYAMVDDLLIESRTVDCNTILGRVNPSVVHPDLALALLMATASIPRPEVPLRAKFYDETRARFVSVLGSMKAAEIFDPLQ